MEKSEITLLGRSISLPEQDEENDNLIEEISYEYDILSIIESIGTPEFKEVYTTNIQNIKKLSIKIQQDFCIQILKKISEKYEYEKLEKIDLLNQDNINEVYNLISFLEYDYLNFFSNVWKYLKVDLRKIDIEKYCKKNSDKIINEIDEQIEIRNLSLMSSDFLRTYIKDNMIRFLIEITKKDKMLMLLIILNGDIE